MRIAPVLLAALGLGLWVLAVCVSIRAFDRANAVRYHWRNHVISELGFPRASRRTLWFNLALTGCGWLLLPLELDVLGGGVRLTAVGMCAGLSAMGLLGLWQDLFPGPYRFLRFFRVHLAFAGIFALGWQGLITRATLQGWRDQAGGRLHQLAPLSSLAALTLPLFLFVALFVHGPMERGLRADLRNPAVRAAFLRPRDAAVLSPWMDRYRPAIWWQAFFEWGVAAAIFTWHLAAMLAWLARR